MLARFAGCENLSNMMIRSVTLLSKLPEAAKFLNGIWNVLLSHLALDANYSDRGLRGVSHSVRENSEMVLCNMWLHIFPHPVL
jgi:hypothetical protein